MSGVSAADHGRPTLAIETYVRLMVLKHRHGWGYRSLVAEVSDSIHLRRFCRIALTERVPDESTVRKLTRRIGEQTVNDITRELIEAAVRERRFRARAVRIDSTVIEADIKYPTDAGLASHGVKLAGAGGPQTGRQAAQGEQDAGARPLAFDGPQAARDLQDDPPAQRGSEGRGARADRADRAAARSSPITEARRLAATARRKARGRGAQAKLRAAAKLDKLADRCEKVATQIKQRVAGEKITDRLISLADPDARPIRKGKLGKPNEFGYVAQIAEVTPNTKRGARGLILPAASLPGNPGENAVATADRHRARPARPVAKGGRAGRRLHASSPTTKQLEDLDPERVFISGRQQPGSRRTQRRLQRYRTGAEGRISHLKRGYGMRRSRLKGDDGQKTWTGWGILAYNLDTLTIRTA